MGILERLFGNKSNRASEDIQDNEDIRDESDLGLNPEIKSILAYLMQMVTPPQSSSQPYPGTTNNQKPRGKAPRDVTGLLNQKASSGYGAAVGGGGINSQLLRSLGNKGLLNVK